ncbi:branched-chain amino acid aminotransferase [Pseudomonas gingeri]|uniref:branched-chain amino acid aminotransferase n=1 Tax=Pseudomonas gingeri TaxID=117681 RepID=UPI00159FBFF9|nr:branched-chain amino acid aminotransferase [Pseudomonas gingeri]NWA01365.1 branched-chain amino acid aminotransferase [Pseudomonas gingeri]NWA13832.1 branched-chain amino acid aminotransferase [Pseudomonas gingeri]NWA52808.1 branched-chain amino acid aminotransferase [Pseudomonas gingeri]NWA96305.1 branched-chain amino acid aminotransferase [Pseudomonas gingeri]NWB00059.1 branched-chain amino acid aminotransferase [Pseudomonas gingeri]
MSGPTAIPFDQRDGYIWLDGEFVEWKDAKIHVLTHGLHYASTVYEGERVYDGKIFQLRAHSERLYRSAQLMDFTIPYDLQTLEAASHALLERNGVTDGYLRPVAWRGSEMISTSARFNSVHLAIACWQWPSYFDPAARMAGIKLKTATWRRPPPSSSPFEAKASGQYMIATLSKHDAENSGYHDALMLDWRGHVAEATSANIFFVKGRQLHTPVPDCFLNGITRQTVIRLARALDYEVIERTLLPDDLGDFDECFLTGTAAEITPVRSIDDLQYEPGRACRDLIDAYAAAVIA